MIFMIFLEKVSENEKDMTPYGSYGKKGFFKLFQEPSKRQLEGRVFTFLDYIDVAIDEEGKSVIGIAAHGDPDGYYKNFPSGYGKEYILNYYNKCRKFNKFIADDVMANHGNDGRETAAWYITLSGFIRDEKEIKTRIPEAELAFWPIYENSQN